ncbi:Beta protein [Streptomyces sp. Ag82_O1-12]|uniref:beta family protein n=1 Tax=unclassified Streptomyces TaxID=2593676 RepID=UPI000BC9A2B6|nr:MULTISPECIES: hypothetical protein [unclassified Streptomyces]SMQ20754.1 Beta protein [Streptomyces sp. Ag82_O1-12]SOD49479.1 Beta protein [Streptomyces sp. Ag82_G6-1]
MVEPIYVPVLPTTRAARSAYAQLDLSVRRRIAPLWTLAPRVGPERPRGRRTFPDPDTDSAELGRWLASRVGPLVEVMDGLPGWVDAAHVECHVEAWASSLWQLTTRSTLRLVTGPERGREHQRHAADLAFMSGRGLGIRVLVDDLPEAHSATELMELVDRLRLQSSQLDLLLDIGPVTDSSDAGKRALAAVDVLGALVAWRRVVLVSGAFPRTLRDLEVRPTRHVERHDWQLNRLLRAARSGARGNIVYGDYSTEHAFSANMASVRQPGPGWGLVRYTTPEGFLIARAPTRGSDHRSRAREMARWIVESGWFRRIGQSEGERWLHACAYGEGARGSGSAEKWIQVGHVQHLHFVVDQLTPTIG